LAAILDDRRLAIIKTAKVIIHGSSQRKHKDVATSFLELAERKSYFSFITFIFINIIY